jgi:hypothetical protein
MGIFGLSGIAAAQVVAAPAGPVNVTTQPSSAVASPNSVGMHFATIELSGNGSGTYAIQAIPITVTAATGFSTGNLSNCQLVNNANGQTLTTGNDTVNAVVNGTNTFTFDTPLQITSATTTLNVTCNVASTVLSGATFQFIAGTPILAPALGVMLNTVQTVPTGTQNAILGIITLDGTGSGTNTNITSIPLTLTESGATPNDFTNCALRSATNFAGSLNTGTNAVGTPMNNGGVTSFYLDTPFSVPAGSGQLMELTCNIASGTPIGSSVTVSINPANVLATNASNGSSITPTTSVSNGYTEPVSGTIAITAAGTVSSVTTTTTTPGTPNTGAGGNAAMNIALLLLSGFVFFAASIFALRRA